MIHPAGIFALFCGLCAASASAAETAEKASDEKLFFLDINVVTASKMEQPLAEAPAAIYVLTAEDIKFSGATQLGEALSSVLGFNIRHGSAGSMIIGGMRGVMKIPMNKLILMIDGMPWISEVYFLPNFDWLPVTLDEIERIEIMKGPGSSIYGSNAMTGVINVITKKTSDTKGTALSLTAGEYSTYVGSLLHGGSIRDKLNYRVSLGYMQRDNFDHIPYATTPSQKMPMASLMADYSINQNSTLSFFGNYIDLREATVDCESTGPIDWGDSDSKLLALKYAAKNPRIMIRSYWMDKNMWNRGNSLGRRELSFNMGHSKAEFQHTLEPLPHDNLVWGSDWVRTYSEGPSISGKHTADTYGAFLDNTYHWGDKIILNAGGRLDYHPNTKETFSHRLAASYFPHPDHRFRFTWGSSFRNPDFIESYYSRRTTIRPGLYYDVIGHSDISPERAQSYELSYMGQASRLGIEVNLYTMKVKDFIYFITTQYWTGTAVPKKMDFQNGGQADIYGEEIELRYRFTDWLSGLANYTHINQQETSSPAREFLTQTPQNMANAQLRAKFKNGVSAQASANYVDVTNWRYYSSWGGGGTAESYLIANAYLGYEFSPRAEVSLAVFNVFDAPHDEYPIASQRIGRRISGTVRYAF